MKKIVIVVCIAFLTGLSGCSPKLTKYTKDQCREKPSPQVLAAVDDNCMMCHKKDFATPGAICARKTVIIDSVVNGRMPKFGSLSKKDLLTLSKW